MNQLIGAADNHNIANGDQSWLSATGDALVKGVPTALVSGVSSIINSVTGFAGWLTRTDIDMIDTYEVLRRYDNDLAQYYEEHKTGVDVGGFIATSLVPGTLGVKVLQGIKAGIMGNQALAATGLMRALTLDYAKLARAEIAAGTSPFSVLNANTLKSLAQGAGASALEFGAFETFATAALYKSPVLDQQSTGDLIWNIAENSALWGGVFGVLVRGTKVYFGVKQLGKDIDKEAFPYKEIRELGDNAPPAMRIINYFDQKFNLPEVSMPTTPMEIAASERFKLYTQEREKTLERLEVKLRTAFTDLAEGDAVIGNKLYEAMNTGAKSTEEVLIAIMNAEKTGRISMAETLEFGDVKYLLPKVLPEGLAAIKDTGDYHLLFANKGTENATGYIITGNLQNLKITESSMQFPTSGDAFREGFDLYRNFNGSFSVNPKSEIVKKSPFARKANNIILDMEKNGELVPVAFPGLADLATVERPLTVNYRNHRVNAGNLKDIDINPHPTKFNPMAGDYLDIQARYIWAQKFATPHWNQMVVLEYDLPLLERAYFSGQDLKGMRIRILEEDGASKAIAAPTGEALKNFIEAQKVKLARAADGMSLQELSLRLNVTEDWLQGSAEGWAKIQPGVDFTIPRYAKIEFPDGVNAFDQMAINKINGLVEYEKQKKVIKNRHWQTAANYFGPLIDRFLAPIDFRETGRIPTREGAGASFAGFANANAGTAAGFGQYIGTQTAAAELAAKTELSKTLNTVISAASAAGKENEAAILWNHLRGFATEDSWTFHPLKSNTLIQKKNIKYDQKTGGYNIKTDAEEIAMSPEVSNLMRVHVQETQRRQVHVSNLKGDTVGQGDDHDLGRIYVQPINTINYKHFVLVEPKEPHLGDKKRVIVAKDEATLRKLVDQVDTDKFRVRTRQESEEWHKALGDYEYSLGINESAVDSMKHRKGILKEMFPTITGGKIFDDIMQWHLRQEELLTKSMVHHMYSAEFQELKELGRNFSNLATSQFRSNIEALEKVAKDPYNDIVRTALNISRASEYPFWSAFNDTVKNWIEGPFNKVKETFIKSPTITDQWVNDVNKAMDQAGLGKPLQSAYTVLAADKNIVDKPWLSSGVAKAQAILTTTLLQWDTLNAVNNAFGATILGSSELKYLMNAIAKGNPDIAGKLAELRTVRLPDGSSLTLPTIAKLEHNAIKNFFADRDNKLGNLKRYTEIGAVTDDIFHQMNMMLDNLTWNFTETAGKIDTNLHKAAEFGRKWTGNKMAEQFTRYLTADAVRQITDIAIEAGVLKSTKEANEWIKIITDKAQGNYLYSQRPVLFQGVVGQAISLFQTYQFNLMQQLLKYVGSGDSKSLALLLGLQGTIYGAQGLPAFNFLNTHIVGNAAGNTNHRDLYYAANSVFGKSLGDWLLYGLGSNALSIFDSSARFNIYSRGDINPRQLTVVPTNLEDIPVVSASVRLVQNAYKTINGVFKGADLWPSFTQAIEHNGLSRPLAGLAQLVQGYTTTNQGSMLSATKDIWTIGQMARLAGGKPFDDAIALDALYRINAYRAKDIAKIRDLGSAIKTTVVGGGEPSEEQMMEFARQYARSGGRIENFSRFFSNTMISANQSQVNKMATDLSRPFAQQLQVLMGGTPLPDFYNQKLP